MVHLTMSELLMCCWCTINLNRQLWYFAKPLCWLPSTLCTRGLMHSAVFCTGMSLERVFPPCNADLVSFVFCFWEAAELALLILIACWAGNIWDSDCTLTRGELEWRLTTLLIKHHHFGLLKCLSKALWWYGPVRDCKSSVHLKETEDAGHFVPKSAEIFCSDDVMNCGNVSGCG